MLNMLRMMLGLKPTKDKQKPAVPISSAATSIPIRNERSLQEKLKDPDVSLDHGELSALTRAGLLISPPFGVVRFVLSLDSSLARRWVAHAVSADEAVKLAHEIVAEIDDESLREVPAVALGGEASEGRAVYLVPLSASKVAGCSEFFKAIALHDSAVLLDVSEAEALQVMDRLRQFSFLPNDDLLPIRTILAELLVRPHFPLVVKANALRRKESDICMHWGSARDLARVVDVRSLLLADIFKPGFIPHDS